MSNEKTQKTDPHPREASTEAAASPKVSAISRVLGTFRSIFTRRLLVILLLVTLVIHGGGLAYYRLRHEPTPTLPPPAEISLGEFHFVADPNEKGRVKRADFTLHVSLLEGIDTTARPRMADRKFRIQQDVEELLRKAHSGDFDDPNLQELKRQLHEKINQTVGLRAIDEIIVTDLRFHREPNGPFSLSTAAHPPQERDKVVEVTPTVAPGEHD